MAEHLIKDIMLNHVKLLVVLVVSDPTVFGGASACRATFTISESII